MQMMPPHHMAMMQGQGGPAKPLFPSAIPTSSPGASIVGADFKPISSGELLHYKTKLLLIHPCIDNIRIGYIFVL